MHANERYIPIARHVQGKTKLGHPIDLWTLTSHRKWRRIDDVILHQILRVFVRFDGEVVVGETEQVDVACAKMACGIFLDVHISTNRLLSASTGHVHTARRGFTLSQVIPGPQPGSKKVLGGKYIFSAGKIFVFITCLKQILLGTTKFGGTQKNRGFTASDCPPWLRAWAIPHLNLLSHLK